MYSFKMGIIIIHNNYRQLKKLNTTKLIESIIFRINTKQNKTKMTNYYQMFKLIIEISI